MKILLVTPPLTQLNTPYPATAHLTGFLRSKEIEAVQMDLSIEWIHTLFTPQSLKSLFDLARRKSPQHPHPFMQHADFCLQKITTVMRFLSGRDRTLAHRLARPEEWYDSRRKPAEEELEWAYGTMGIEGKAQLFCTLFLRDLCDFIRSEIDPNFELIRYAEKICTRLPHFHKLHQQLQQAPGALEEQILSLLRQRILQEQPEWIGFAVPFPGNLWSTLRCCQMIKEFGSIQIVMGGGYVNTELRQLSDATLFDYIDYLTFDDGELPLWRLLSGGPLLRTITRQPNGELKFHQIDSKEQIPFAQLSAPDYGGLTDNAYLNLIEFCNPMHALWGNGQWNKMMLSHGCYWAKCAFCDVTLDYIKRFEPAKASSLVDRMERIMEQTGEPGFHFVDEAASPQILRQLSEEIIRRGLTVTYWTNIRFEKSFTLELCQLMAQAGCIAVAGGLEVASPRILKAINKGITIETASRSMDHLTRSGILVHAYLMYGFPTETEQETIDSLEIVRQMFQNGLIQSAFWHRYAMTVHSPSGQSPEQYGVKHVKQTVNPFANNEIPFYDPQKIRLDMLGKGVELATYNYMRAAGLELPVQKWFKEKVPAPTHSPHLIERYIYTH